MIKRRLQVFISSTYTDLKEERQAAVEAVLKAGHIPAGMELFAAGNRSQLEVVKDWIKESDVYILLLGARYGSIEPISKLSYTEVEFDYARQLNLPFFSVILSDAGRAAKVTALGESVLERENVPLYDKFREKVQSHQCAFFESTKDVKLAVLEALPGIAMNPNLVGWIPASAVTSEKTTEELARLLEENRKLRESLERAKKAQSGTEELKTLAALVKREHVTVTADMNTSGRTEEIDLLHLLVNAAGPLAGGVTNQVNVSAFENFLFYTAAPMLASFGLVEAAPVPRGITWERRRLSGKGVAFLNWCRENISWSRPNSKQNPVKSVGTSPKSQAKLLK